MTEDSQLLRQLQDDLKDTVSGRALDLSVSKWFVKYGSDHDDFARHTIKTMDEEDWRDTELFRKKRRSGKQARYAVKPKTLHY